MMLIIGMIAVVIILRRAGLFAHRCCAKISTAVQAFVLSFIQSDNILQYLKPPNSLNIYIVFVYRNGVSESSMDPYFPWVF